MKWRNISLSRCVVLTLSLFVFAAPLAFADVSSVTASVDKNPAMADESIVLTVVAVGDADNNAFDPSVLAQDFVVGRTSVSTQTRVVNFDATRSTTWSTVLIPRREGTFTIPAFTIDGKSSQAITVRVIPASAGSPAQARQIFVTAEADVTQPYVQQVVKYTIKIHLATDLKRGNLPNPTVQNAEILPLGKDQEYTDIIDGQRYRIIQRSFAIVPQNSGKLTIKGPLFEGEITDRSRNSFSYFNQSKVINRVTPDVELDVQPIPANYSHPWLPSEFVQLNEQWQPELQEITVGEPITRTITLSVLGVTEQQLPKVSGDYPPDFKVYPDQPTTTSVPRDDNLVAQRVENIALIPNRPGNFVLPAIQVPWFNVLTEQVEYAQLPARSVTVLPASGATNNPAVTEPQTSAPVATPPAADGASAPSMVTGAQSTSWWSVSSWVLLALWLATLLLWWLTKRQSSTAANPHNDTAGTTDDSEQARWRALQQAIKQGQINQIYTELHRWLVTLSGGQARTMAQLQQHLDDPGLNQQIKLLLASRYAQGDNHWKSDKLQAELERIRQTNKQSNNQQTILMPLYGDS